MGKQIRKRKMMPLIQMQGLLSQILAIREQGQLLRMKHDQLMSQLAPTLSAGDVIVLPAVGSQPCRRVTVLDPFITSYGLTCAISKSVTVDRFQFDVQTTEEQPCPQSSMPANSQDPSAQAQDAQ